MEQAKTGPEKGRGKAKHAYVPEVGEEVAYVPAGHRQHLGQKTQPRRPWEALPPPATSGATLCSVLQVQAFKAVPLVLLQATSSSSSSNNNNNEDADVPDKTPPFCAVQLQPSSPPGAPPFYVTIYLQSDLPEFVVKRALFDASHNVKADTRVRMWFANEEKRGGTWYQGTVVENTMDVSGEPWECVKVLWDNDDEVTEVCPWEVSLFDDKPEGAKAK